MQSSELDYELPAERIAQHPAEPRSSARLLVALDDEVHLDRRVADLADMVGPGDLIVVNDTRVRSARLNLWKPTGGRVEVLILDVDHGESVAADEPDSIWWEAMIRPARRAKPGTRLSAEGPDGPAVVEVGEPTGDGTFRVRAVAESLPNVMDRFGQPPLPPYIEATLEDPERYQTVYARRPGSAAAPTAGLHLTPQVLDACRAAGAQVAAVELVVGRATFQPISVDHVADHPMHAERIEVSDEVMAAVEAADRVIAVGTTTLRALESAARGVRSGPTDLFVRRPFEFRAVDVLLTNFHMPRSSLLALLDAFVGDRWRDLYTAALEDGFRFLSFGDAMIVAATPPTGASAGGQR